MTSPLDFDWHLHSEQYYWASHWRTPLIATCVYLLFITLSNSTLDHPLRVKTSNWTKSSHVFKTFSILHNAALVLFSSIIFVGFSLDFIDYTKEHGWSFILCPPVENQNELLRGRIFYWCYLYYISKFYELADTLLMAVKGKRIQGLHAYHHAIMMPTMWLCFNGNQVCSLFGLAFFNSFVHIVMYTFYLCTIVHIPTKSWKQWVNRTCLSTMMDGTRNAVITDNDPCCFLLVSFLCVHQVTKVQIFQFIFGAAGSTSFMFMYIQQPRLASPWFIEGCAGERMSIGMTYVVNISFLFLFIDFHKNTYKPTTATTTMKKE